MRTNRILSSLDPIHIDLLLAAGVAVLLSLVLESSGVITGQFGKFTLAVAGGAVVFVVIFACVSYARVRHKVSRRDSEPGPDAAKNLEPDSNQWEWIESDAEAEEKIVDAIRSAHDHTGGRVTLTIRGIALQKLPSILKRMFDTLGPLRTQLLIHIYHVDPDFFSSLNYYHRDEQLLADYWLTLRRSVRIHTKDIDTLCSRSGVEIHFHPLQQIPGYYAVAIDTVAGFFALFRWSEDNFDFQRTGFFCLDAKDPRSSSFLSSLNSQFALSHRLSGHGRPTLFQASDDAWRDLIEEWGTRGNRPLDVHLIRIWGCVGDDMVRHLPLIKQGASVRILLRDPNQPWRYPEERAQATLKDRIWSNLHLLESSREDLRSMIETGNIQVGFYIEVPPFSLVIAERHELKAGDVTRIGYLFPYKLVKRAEDGSEDFSRSRSEGPGLKVRGNTNEERLLLDQLIAHFDKVFRHAPIHRFFGGPSSAPPI